MKTKILLYGWLFIVFLTSCSTGAPAKPAPDETATAAGICDNLEFVSDSNVPTGTTMTAGQEFVKTWKVKNTGDCSWTTGYNITFAYGEQMSGESTPLAAHVLPNTEAEVSIKLAAPTEPGTYYSYWRLQNDNHFPFGTFLSIIIVVP